MECRQFLDKITPLPVERWSGFFSLLVLFMWIVIYFKTHFVVCYALWIYLLNGFILFLTPMVDPEEPTETPLPLKNDDEFKPFRRRLPEMAFWEGAFMALVISLASTPFSIFDIPVFWPILVLYFFVLSFIMLRTQIQHMIKYRYIPFNLGKKRYKSELLPL